MSRVVQDALRGRRYVPWVHPHEAPRGVCLPRACQDHEAPDACAVQGSKAAAPTVCAAPSRWQPTSPLSVLWLIPYSCRRARPLGQAQGHEYQRTTRYHGPCVPCPSCRHRPHPLVFPCRPPSPRAPGRMSGRCIVCGCHWLGSSRGHGPLARLPLLLARLLSGLRSGCSSEPPAPPEGAFLWLVGRLRQVLGHIPQGHGAATPAIGGQLGRTPCWGLAGRTKPSQDQTPQRPTAIS